MGGDWVDDGIIALSAKSVKSGRLINLNKANKVSREMYDKWMKTKLKDGDILMTSEAPLGEFYYVLTDTEYCQSQRLYGIRADQSQILPSYLYRELSCGNGFTQIMGSQSGSTVFGIRQAELRKINVLVPTMTVQKKYDEIVTPMFEELRNLEMETREYEKLRDFLLPMTISGQITFRESGE